MKGKKSSKSIRYIEIKTNRNGWTKVQLLKCLGKKLLVRMPDGQIIARKNKQVRPVQSIVTRRKISLLETKETKAYKSKRRLLKNKRKNSNRKKNFNKGRKTK